MYRRGNRKPRRVSALGSVAKNIPSASLPLKYLKICSEPSNYVKVKELGLSLTFPNLLCSSAQSVISSRIFTRKGSDPLDKSPVEPYLSRNLFVTPVGRISWNTPLFYKCDKYEWGIYRFFHEPKCHRYGIVILATSTNEFFTGVTHTLEFHTCVTNTFEFFPPVIYTFE